MADNNKDEVKDETKNDSNSRREAIEKGIDEVDGKEEKKDDKKDSSKKENEDSSEGEDSSTDEDEVNKEESTQAINLFRALNNPETGPKILKILAQEAGLLDGSSKETKKEVAKSIKSVIKEKLGSEYQFLADRLGDALEEVVNEVAKERIGKVEERLDNREKAELNKEVDIAMKESFEQYEEIPKNVLAKFNDLIDEMPPVPGKTKPLAYFNRLIKIAFEEAKVTPKLVSKTKGNELSQVMKDRLKRNKNDATSRLASRGAEAEVDDTSKNAPQPKSRREAIERAVKETEAAQKA